MHCTRIRARARHCVISRAPGASAFHRRSAAKRRERSRERAEQAGGFPALEGGGRGVGDFFCNAPCRLRCGASRGVSFPVARHQPRVDASSGVPELTRVNQSFCSRCSLDRVVEPHRQWKPAVGATSGGYKWKPDDARDSAIRARPWGRVGGARISNHGNNVSEATATEVPSLLTLKQAASRLGVCRRTLERLIAAREFPAPVKIKKCSRVPEVDVQAFVEKLIRERAEGRAP